MVFTDPRPPKIDPDAWAASQALQGYSDNDLADALRSRGFRVYPRERIQVLQLSRLGDPHLERLPDDVKSKLLVHTWESIHRSLVQAAVNLGAVINAVHDREIGRVYESKIGVVIPKPEKKD